ncbi:PREDICTED: gustatory and pheromone receptor 32a-like [Polistes dominula]|uniref:Gustatory and pheromone receptor 32a-like n=1 Tax=Polistes dominula TaxID=743375 RepID=A0ABM1JB56_POLDO|nr:PREDICTED: gustatory and pheromone receptor 32a-like [Polistes dominula]
MLTTNIYSPQHKRVLQMENNKKNDFLLSDIYSTNNSNDDVVKMKKIKEIHLELIKCARNVIDTYGLHILLTITMAFILITVISYNIYYTIITSNKPTYGIRRINYLLLFFCLHASNTGDILCELYEPSTSMEFRTEIRDFIVQLIQNPLSFTACGYIDLDHTLISGVIGTVTTYLVILIQIGSTQSKNVFENSTVLSNNSF